MDYSNHTREQLESLAKLNESAIRNLQDSLAKTKLISHNRMKRNRDLIVEITQLRQTIRALKQQSPGDARYEMIGGKLTRIYQTGEAVG